MRLAAFADNCVFLATYTTYLRDVLFARYIVTAGTYNRGKDLNIFSCSFSIFPFLLTKLNCSFSSKLPLRVAVSFPTKFLLLSLSLLGFWSFCHLLMASY